MGGIIKVLVQALFGGAALALPEIIKRILVSLGIGAVTYIGMEALLDNLSDLVTTQFQGLPSQAAIVLGLMEADRFCTNILAALAIRLSLNTFNGVQKRVTF